MAIRQINYADHKKHREYVAKNQGIWVGLLDEDGVPLMDLPTPERYSAQLIRNSVGSCNATIPAQNAEGITIPAVSELIADNLGIIDDEGLLIPSNDETRFLCFERPNGVRETFLITHCKASGVDAKKPSTLEIYGAGLLSYLDGIPAWSAPTHAKAGEWKDITRDWVGPEDTDIVFDEPVTIKGNYHALRADGVTLSGKANEIIKEIIDNSLEVIYDITGIEDNPIITNLVGKTESPTVLIRQNDESIWKTVIDVATSAGVQLSARLWLPGDDPIPGKNLKLPTIVINIDQEG